MPTGVPSSRNGDGLTDGNTLGRVFFQGLSMVEKETEETYSTAVKVH